MSREVLAIDLDDVVLPTAEPLLEYYNQTYGTNLQLSDYYSSDLTVLQAPNIGTAIERFHVYLESEEFFNLPPTQESVQALEQLQESFDLYAVTGRHSVVEEATKLWLEQHFQQIFQDAIFTNYYNPETSVQLSTKAAVCRSIGAVLLIEDHLDHALRVADEGIDVLLFGSYPWNQSDQLPANVRRVEGWSEITELLLNETN